jgi:hypothetical protein
MNLCSHEVYVDVYRSCRGQMAVLIIQTFEGRNPRGAVGEISVRMILNRIDQFSPVTC